MIMVHVHIMTLVQVCGLLHMIMVQVCELLDMVVVQAGELVHIYTIVIRNRMERENEDVLFICDHVF